MRLIDADAFDKALEDAQIQCKRNGGNFRFGVLSTVRANLEKAPTVGETTRPVFNGRFWECEECGQRYKDILVVKEYKHCPGCGRKIERWY